jgi:hypothetical protein
MFFELASVPSIAAYIIPSIRRRPIVDKPIDPRFAGNLRLTGRPDMNSIAA